MRLVNYLALPLLSILIGCSHTSLIGSDPLRASRTYDSFNENMAESDLVAILRDSTRVEIKNIKAGPDSTRWVEVKSGQTQTVATSHVLRVIQRDHAGGALAGLLIGLGSGTAICWAEGQRGVDFYGFLFVGGVGGLLGTVVGASIGNNNVYELASDSPANASSLRKD